MVRALLLTLALSCSLTPAIADDGGGEGSEAPALAVEKALRWLKTRQEPEGYFPDEAKRDVGTTAKVALAFLGQGHTHRFGTYKRTVSKALRWLKRQQRRDGSIGYDPKQPETILDHFLATWSLAEAYAVSRDFTLKRYVEKALAFTLEGSTPWSLKGEAQPDTVGVGFATMALKACKTAGIAVPAEAWERVRKHFDAVSAASGQVGLRKAGDGGPSKTLPLGEALAYLSRLFAGQRRSELGPLMKRLRAKPPAWKAGERDYVYWYFGTYALFQQGGEPWKAWFADADTTLLGNQREDGSWPAVDTGQAKRGEVFTTAFAVAALEIWCRYERARNYER